MVPVAPFRGASGINPYGDFVMQVDHLMGSLLDCLSEQGLEQNTLVIFTSDNGCSPQANFEVLEEHGHDPSGIYRGHKADVFEGGHRVPFIVKWPGHIQAGTVSRGLTCHTDVYATLEEVVGKVGESGGGEDGFSLVPVFHGKQCSARTGLVSHSIDGSFAIRDRDWKLCLCYGSGGWSAPKEKQAKADGLPPLAEPSGVLARPKLALFSALSRPTFQPMGLSGILHGCVPASGPDMHAAAACLL